MRSTAPTPRRWRLLVSGALAAAVALFAAGCERSRDDGTRVDAEWHRRALVDGLLAPWLGAAPTPNGFMRSAFDRHWKAQPQQPGSLTEQARLVYSLAIGYEQTRDPRYLAAAESGAEFLLTRFHDPVHGGFFDRVAPDGTVVHDAKGTYGQAFALFALSHMFRVTGEARYRKAAMTAWLEIDSSMRDPHGGYWGELPRNFSPAGAAKGYRSQNPVMHLFEALLALHAATQDPAALAAAKRVADFVVYRLLVGTPDGGAYIPEWYDAEWRPLATRDEGAYTDIGHQFEWSHLLMSAERQGMVGVYAQTAERLLQFAVAKGYDEVDGGAFNRLYPDGGADRDKYWWQQCEAMRALLAVASETQRPDMWRRYEQTLNLVRGQFFDPKNGGWHARACRGGDCADAQVDPYHMTALHHAALRLAGEARQ